MQLYVIQRRNAWASADELGLTAERSATEGDKPDSGVRWIRSYVIQEESGELGTFCIYEGESPEAIRAHAAATEDTPGRTSSRSPPNRSASNRTIPKKPGSPEASTTTGPPPAPALIAFVSGTREPTQ